MLLIVTYRGDELTRRHPLYQLLPILVRESSATRLALHPLESGDTKELVRGRFGLSDDDDTVRLVAYLHERGEGNPFFIGELLETLADERVLREEGDRWEWITGSIAGEEIEPRTIRGASR